MTPTPFSGIPAKDYFDEYMRASEVLFATKLHLDMIKTWLDRVEAPPDILQYRLKMALHGIEQAKKAIKELEDEPHAPV